MLYKRRIGGGYFVGVVVLLMENDMEEAILDRAKNSPIKRVWMLQHFESPPDDSGRDMTFWSVSGIKKDSFLRSVGRLKEHLGSSQKILIASTLPLSI